jgi:hypothetical protein
MRFSEDDLNAAVAAGVLEQDRKEQLVAFLRTRAPAAPEAVTVAAKFDLAHVLWYAGALIVIGSMGLFSTLAFSMMGGAALTVTAIAYAAAFTAAGHHLWHRHDLHVPGGLLIAIAVSMAPLAVYGIQDALGLWGRFGTPGTVRDFYVWIKGSWVFMEMATVAAGIVALRHYRFPFIVAIIAFALWFMSMDLTPWIFGRSEFTWEERRDVSMWFGLAVLVVAWIVDRRPRGGDFAFWLHLFGLMAFWGGLSLHEGGSELSKLAYCLINVALVLVSVLLVRRAYAVYGALGVSLYLGHLAGRVFKDSLMFPFALSLIGIAVIAAGLFYHRKQDAIAAWLNANLPGVLKSVRPAHAE